MLPRQYPDSLNEPDLEPLWPIGWTLAGAFAVSSLMWWGIYLAVSAMIQAFFA